MVQNGMLHYLPKGVIIQNHKTSVNCFGYYKRLMANGIANSTNGIANRLNFFCKLLIA